MKTKYYTEVENFLYTARNLQFTVDEMQKSIEIYKRDVSGLKAVNYEKDRITGGELATVGDTVEKMEHTITKMLYDELEAINKLFAMRIAVHYIADLLAEDKTLQGLIIARYINCKSWAEIAQSLNYGIDNVYRLHRVAIRTLNDEHHEAVHEIIEESQQQ